MQPQWKKLLNDLQGLDVRVTYKMGGLLPSWKHFNDTVNSIQKPVQMGPEWMHARALSGAIINDLIWITDPPASSFPACIAVKCAELQSAEIGANLLHLLQEAVMTKSLNIAKGDVLLEVASSLPAVHPEFDLSRFRKDLFGEKAKEAFRRDFREFKYLNVSRLPTILFKSPDKGSILVSGYQSYETLKNVFSKLDCS